jgi:hypothetical protein
VTRIRRDLSRKPDVVRVLRFLDSGSGEHKVTEDREQTPAHARAVAAIGSSVASGGKPPRDHWKRAFDVSHCERFPDMARNPPSIASGAHGHMRLTM